MEIIYLDETHLSDFQTLYTRFFIELRGKQGWKPGEEEIYRKEAEVYFKRGDVIFLALEGAKTAGFIRVSSREGCFWVEEIYVRPEFRGKGIGRALVERAEEEVKKHDSSLYLLVLPQDKDAIGFWKRLGYDVINTVELVKDLKETPRGEDFHTVELLGERFRIFEWKGEKFTDGEKRFMELLERFYKKSGTKKEFLELVNRALEGWLENNGIERIGELIESLSKRTGRKFKVSPKELWMYLHAETYEEDIFTPNGILSNDYLLFHELVEIECLKGMGLEITPRVIIENPETVYECHLKALEEELKFALKKGDAEWVKKRLRDTESYLEDENLPEKLKDKVVGILGYSER